MVEVWCDYQWLLSSFWNILWNMFCWDLTLEQRLFNSILCSHWIFILLDCLPCKSCCKHKSSLIVDRNILNNRKNVFKSNNFWFCFLPENISTCGEEEPPTLWFLDNQLSHKATATLISLFCLFFVFSRAPRFKGYQQQDSQELLHYLLDSIRVEETKVSSYQSTYLCIYLHQSSVCQSIDVCIDTYAHISALYYL